MTAARRPGGGNGPARRQRKDGQASRATLLEAVERARQEESLVLELTGAMSRELQLEPLLVRIMETVTRLLDAERATLFMYDADTAELWALAGQGEGLSQIRFPARSGLAGHVFSTGETVNIEDTYADPRFNPDLDRRTGFHTRSMLCMPVFDRDGAVVAVTQVLNKRGGSFTELDERRLRAFSAQTSIALDRARLFEAFMEKERFENSLRLAHDIQMGMLPKTFPISGRFELAARLMPARSVGGDLYDFILDGDRLFFLIGDVAGKGVAAALFMAVTKTLFRATIQAEPDLGAALAKVNRELCRDNERSMFVTAFAGWLDLTTGEMVFGNAGHNLPYRVRGDLTVVPVTGGHGVAMGILPDYDYKTGSLRLESGDTLFLCTDGVLEALDARGEQFGAGRLVDQLTATARAPAEIVVREVVRAVDDFAKGARQFDDITVMSLRYAGQGGADPL